MAPSHNPDNSSKQSNKRRHSGPPATASQSASKRSRIGGVGGIAYTPTDRKLASIFERLADEVSEQRIGAAKELIELVQETLSNDATTAAAAATAGKLQDEPVIKKEKDSDDDDEEMKDVSVAEDQVQTQKTGSAKDEPASTPSSQELVTKALRRLVRGVCSGRKGARFGFSIALTEILRLLYSPDSSIAATESGKDVIQPRLTDLVNYVVQHTELEGKTSGQERRDFLFGRLYALVAIMQSGILFHPRPEAETAELVSMWKQMIEIVCKLEYNVPWLREECGSSLYESAKALLALAGAETEVKDEDTKKNEKKKDKMKKKDSKSEGTTSTSAATSSSFSSTAVQFLQVQIDTFHESRLFRTPEGIALWLLYSQSPVADKLTLPTGVWQDQSPLSPNERTRLAAIMREDYSRERQTMPVLVDEEQPIVKKDLKPGIWKSQPNFAWAVVIEAQLAVLKKVESGQDKIAEKFGEFWRCIVDDNLFSATASDERRAWGLQVLSSTILSCPPPILPTLLSPNLLKTIVHHRSSNKSNLHGASATPLRMLTNRVTADSTLAVPVLAALLALPGCANFDHVTKGHTVDRILDTLDVAQVTELVKKLLEVIEQPGTTKKEDADLTEKTRLSVIENLVIVVKSQVRIGADRFQLESDDSWCVLLLQKFARLGFLKSGCAEESASFKTTVRTRLNTILSSLLSLRQSALWPAPYVIVSYISKAVDSEKHALELDADETVLSILKKMNATIKKIRKIAAKAEAEQKHIWDALNLLFSLTVIQVYSSEGEAVSLAEDLLEFYDGMDKKSCDFTPLVEILLSLVAKPSVLLRKLAEQVFSEFTGFIGADGLDSLLHILDKSEDKAGMQDLFQNEDELELGSDIEGDDDDVEMIDGEGDSDVEVVDESDVDSESGDDEDENDGNEDELAKFNDLLAKALKTKNPHSKKDGADSDSEDGEDMDDDEMMAIDAQLTEAFKSQSGLSRKGEKKADPKKDAKQAKEAVINFKNRSLDLLAIFLKQESHRPICRAAILPLIKLVRTTTQPQLANKAKDVLGNYYEQAKSASARKNRAEEAAIPEKAAKGKKSKKSKGDKSDEVDSLLTLLIEIHNEGVAALTIPSPTKTFFKVCSSANLFVCRCVMMISADNYATISELHSQTQKRWVVSSMAPSRSAKGSGDDDEAAAASRRRAEKNQHLAVPFFTDFVSWSSDMIRESWRRQADASEGEKAGAKEGKEEVEVIEVAKKENEGTENKVENAENKTKKDQEEKKSEKKKKEKAEEKEDKKAKEKKGKKNKKDRSNKN